MTKREFAMLLVRLMGLYVIASSFSSLTHSSYIFFGQHTFSIIARLLICLVPFVLQVCFGAFLCLFSSALARAMTSGLHENEPISQWQPREFAQAALTVIGILFVMQGVQLDTTVISQAAVMSLGTPVSSIDYVQLLAEGAPSVFLGFILILGARFVSFWIAPRREYMPSLPNETAPDASD